MPDGPVLALDIGTVRIGVAISDAERRMALPLATLDVAEDAEFHAQVAALIQEQGATTLVVGYPLSLSGEPGPKAGEVAAVADRLASALAIPVVLHDERLSTVEAQRRLAEAGIRGKQQRAVVDATAATVILESFLATLRGN